MHSPPPVTLVSEHASGVAPRSLVGTVERQSTAIKGPQVEDPRPLVSETSGESMVKIPGNSWSESMTLNLNLHIC